MKVIINDFINKYSNFYENNSKFLKFSAHILLALGIYLNYLNFVNINLMNHDALLLLIAIIALFSYYKPSFGCGLMMGMYAIHLIPTNLVLFGAFAVLFIIFLTFATFEKNSIIFVAIVYLLLACENPFLLGLIITLYYILFVQRDYGMPPAISVLLTYKALVTDLFFNTKIFNVVSHEVVPESLKEYLYSFFDVYALEGNLIGVETIAVLKEHAVPLLLILLISCFAFMTIRVVASESPFKIEEHLRLGLVSYIISTVLLVVLIVVGSYNNTISGSSIFSAILGSTMGFVLSCLIVRYPRYGGPVYVDVPSTTIDIEQQKEEEKEEKKNFGILPYEGEENYIFISYSHRDTELVLPVLKILEEKGFRFWYDEGISPGDEWPEAIGIHLANCSVCLAFISENSLNSRNCRREINMALNKEIDFLSVFFNPVDLSPGVELQISSYQSIMRYKYNSDEEFITALLTANAIQTCQEVKTNN